jgi:hypothetical protein
MTKEEKAAYMKKYREEHLEEINANRRYWYRQNKERVKQYNKTYYEAHRTTPPRPKRTWDETRDAHRVVCKKYYEKNKNDPEFKAMLRASQAKWLEKNRDKWNAYLREYRKRKKLERSAG